MRHGDSLRIALVKLRQRWGRALFAVVVLAIAVVPPILVLDLYDGARSVIKSSAEASGADPRNLSIFRRTSGVFRQLIALTPEDRELIRALPGLVDQQVPRYFSHIYLRLADGEIISRAVAAKPSFVQHHLAPGQVFASSQDGDVVPVLIGKLSLLYRQNLQHVLERVDRDLDAMIGQHFELHVGDMLHGLRGIVRIRDMEKGEYRLATEAEWRTRAEAIRARTGRQFDLDAYDSSLVVTARVVGLRPGHGLTLPNAAVDRFFTWLRQRHDRSTKLAAYKTPATSKSLQLRFETQAAAIAATEVLKAKDLTVSSYHEILRRSFERIRIAVYIVGGVVAMLLLLACFLVSSVLARVILDARREIGLLRALGARQSHVIRIYMYEAALLCGLGSLLGVIIGNVAAAVISSWALGAAAKQTTSFYFIDRWIQLYQIDFLPDSLWRFAPEQFLWIVFAVSLAMVSAWFPARRSARLDPTSALRLE